MKLITSFYYTFATKLFSILLLFLSRILTAQLLGPAGIGSLGSALNFITIISRWGTLGIAPAAQFTGSKYPLQKNILFVYVLFSSVLLGVLNLLVLEYFENEILNWQFRSDSSGQFAYLQFIPWLPAIILSMTLPVFLLGAGRIVSYSFTQILPVLLQTAIIAIAYYQHESLCVIISAQIIGWVSAAVIALLLIDYKNFKLQIDKDLLLIYAKYSLKAWPQVMLQFGIARFAILVGSQYLTNKNLGYYILASNLSESFLIISTSVTPLIFNRIASKGPDIELMTRSLRFTNLLLLIIFMIVLLIGKPVFLFFFGIEFEQTWTLFSLLLISVFFYGMIRICINYLAALSRNRVVSGIQLIELIVLFISSILFCPVFGTLGLCYAGICASIAGFISCMIALRETEGKKFNLLSVFIFTNADVNTLFQIVKKANHSGQIEK